MVNNQISSLKSQISSKSQVPILEFVNWNLFGTCILKIGA
jgi:hypothetical protein